MLYIKESYVYEFQEMHCHQGDCGYWRAPNDHSMQGSKMLRMFKVNGQYTCEACLKEATESIQEWLE
jgi:hypothetical protein